MEIASSFANADKTSYLTDTGSDICLIKKKYLNGDVLCYPNVKLRLHGITSDIIETMGACETILYLSDTVFVRQIFHIVSDDFPLYSHGIIGYDFFELHKCIIDFSKFLIEIPDLQVKLKLCAHKNDFQIPARTEKTVLMKLSVDSDDEYLIRSNEILPGVFVANTISYSINGYAPVNILNSNENNVSIASYSASAEKLSDFNIYPINNWSNKISDRIKILESELIADDLNAEERNSILKIMREFNDVFFVEGDQLSVTDASSHSIPIKENSKIVNIKPYRLPESMKTEIDKQVEEMLQNNIIKPSSSPWNSPLLVVPKKSTTEEKKWRVVVDYRKLNDITIGSVFPLPNITEILDQLGKCSYFSTLDLANGYHQIPIDQEDCCKTAFSTAKGHYEFNRMSFGLKGAPATFQRTMNCVLSGLNGIKCLVYLDDIVVYGYDLNDHNSKLKLVLSALRKYNLKLNAKKCNFLRKEVTYLGHIISTDGIRPDLSKIESVTKFPQPINKKQIKSFIGLASYYRKFIDNFSAIAQPLTDKLQKKVTFSWNAQCDNAFKTLKNALTTAPVLQYPEFERPFYLSVDASDFALGAVLSQKFNGENDLPIAYASRVLNSAERHYPTIKKECLAIIYAVRKFRPYIYGRKFFIVTDHRPLTWLKNVSNPASILIRWRLELEEYEYEIIHKSGILNTNADALSRISYPSETQDIRVVTRSQSKTTSQSSNHNSVSSGPTLIQNDLSTTPSPISPTSPISPNPVVDDKLLVDTKSSSNSNKTNQINNNKSPVPKIVSLVSDEDIQKVLHDFHFSPLGGHQGVMRTYKRLKVYYSFPRMIERIRKFVKTCSLCQKNKIGPQNKLPMTITTTSSKPMEKIFMDIVGPFSSSLSNNRFILTIQDDLSKYSIAIALHNQEVLTIAKAFVEHFICKFGAPNIILSDQGANFMSNFMKELCKLLKIEKISTSAYHPQSNGTLERSHRTLGEYLRNYTNGDTANWDEWLPFAMFCYNSTPHVTTNLMPFEVLYGYKPNIPSSFTNNPSVNYNYDDYISDLRFRLQTSYALAKKNSIKQKEKNKIYYDRNSNNVTFEIGNLVLLKKENRSKLDPLWTGPHKVTEIISATNTRILVKTKLPSGRTKQINKIVHNNRLKIYIPTQAELESNDD